MAATGRLRILRLLVAAIFLVVVTVVLVKLFHRIESLEGQVTLLRSADRSGGRLRHLDDTSGPRFPVHPTRAALPIPAPAVDHSITGVEAPTLPLPDDEIASERSQEERREARRQLATLQFESQPLDPSWARRVEDALGPPLDGRLGALGLAMETTPLECREWWCAVSVTVAPEDEGPVDRTIRSLAADSQGIDGKLLLARMGNTYYFRFVDRLPGDWADRWGATTTGEQQ